jgi:hypothetical protein
MAFELYFMDHHGLIEMIMPLQKLDDEGFIRRVMMDTTIRQKIADTMEDERYRLIREAAFR